MATISNTITHGITLGTSGVYASPLTITMGGAIEAADTGIYGSSSRAWTIANAGTVAASLSTSVGIDLKDGGTIGNTGSVSGGHYAVRIAGGSGAVTNSGKIAGRTDGVVLRAGGVVNNQTNGTILGTTNVGVYFTGGAGTLTNAGTIAGAGSGMAVQFIGSYTNRVILDPGAVFSGKVQGGSGSNTLELAEGVGTGTVSGIGAQFTGFGTIGVDAGASWVVAGTDAVFGSLSITGGAQSYYSPQSGGTLLNNGMLSVAGTLTVQYGAGARTGFYNGLGGELLNAGTLTNTGTLLLSGADGGGNYLPGGTGGTLTNTGVLVNSKLLTLTGGGGGYYGGGSGGGGVLINSGMLTNTGTLSLGGGGGQDPNDGPAGGNGSQLVVSGTLVNTGLITIGTGTNIGYGPGIDASLTITSTGTLDNFGTITGRTIPVLLTGGTLANKVSGTIVGEVQGTGSAVVTNEGNISGMTGVALQAGGSIINQAGGVLTGTSNVGSYIKGGVGTITNAGTIIGSVDAVQFAGSFANRLIIDPGAVFNGRIVGGSGVDTLELAGTTGHRVTVDYNGLGLSNFENVQFGGGGYSTFDVSNVSGVLPITITGFDDGSDIIDLTAIGTDGHITTNDTIDHRLTVAGSGGSVTLQFDAAIRSASRQSLTVPKAPMLRSPVIVEAR